MKNRSGGRVRLKNTLGSKYFGQSSRCAVFEALEERRVLSSIATEAADTSIPVEPNPYAETVITAQTPVAQRSYIDASGNKVTLALTGPGTLMLQREDAAKADAAGYVLTETTLASSFTITVTKGAGSLVDTTTVGSINIQSPLGSLLGTKLNLLGDITSFQEIRSLTLNDVIGSGQQIIQVGGETTDKSVLVFGRLADVSISVYGAVTSFKALEWLDDVDGADKFSAYSLGTFTLTGKAGTKLAAGFSGDMEADINLWRFEDEAVPVPVAALISIAGHSDGSWDLGAHKLNSAVVKGDASGTWRAHAGFGSLTIGGNATNLAVDTIGDIASISIKGDADQLKLPSVENLGAVTVGGSLSNSTLNAYGNTGALSFGAIIQSQISVGGNFGAATIKGAADQLKLSAESLGAFTVGGTLSNSELRAHHNIGALSFGGATQSSLYADGDIASFAVKGLVESVELSSDRKIGAVTIKGAADQLKLLAQNLGAFTMDGTLSNSELHAYNNMGALSFGAAMQSVLYAEGDIASFTVKGQVESVNLTSDRKIGAVSSANWLGGGIWARKIASITTRGQLATAKAAGITGDFTGGIWVIRGLFNEGTTLLGTVTIAGGLNEATWSVEGKTGPLTFGWMNQSSLNFGGDVSSFTSKGAVTETSIEVYGIIGAISAASWTGGLIGAAKVSSLTTRGQAQVLTNGVVTTPFDAGDFSAMVRVAGAIDKAGQISLGPVSIKGLLTGPEETETPIWAIRGGVATITAGSLLHFGLAIESGSANLGNLGSLTIAGAAVHVAMRIEGKIGAVNVGAADTVEIITGSDLVSFASKGRTRRTVLAAPEGMIGTVSSITWDQGKIMARKIASVAITGQLQVMSNGVVTKPAMSGDFYAIVYASGEGVAAGAPALGSVRITGVMTHSLVEVNGNAGSFTIGAMDESVVRVGVSPDVPLDALPDAVSQFTVYGTGKTATLATLASFTVTWDGVNFRNSRVAAGILSNVSLKRVDLSVEGLNGFAAAKQIGTYIRQTGLPKPADVVRVNNQTAPNEYDDGGAESGYVLKIVGE